MSKLFTDNQKWKKRWFRRLPLAGKLAFFYILDNCDRGGFWDIDEDRLRFDTGLNGACEQPWAGIKDFVERDGIIWVQDFVEFQYPGGLKAANRAHIGIIDILQKRAASFPEVLQKYNIKALARGFGSPQQGRQDMEKDMEKEEKRQAPSEGLARGLPATPTAGEPASTPKAGLPDQPAQPTTAGGQRQAGLLDVKEIVEWCCQVDKGREDVAWRLAVLYGDAGKHFGIAPKGSKSTVGRWLGEFWPDPAAARESDTFFQYAIRRFVLEVEKCERKAAEKPIWETVLAKKCLGNIGRLRDDFRTERARGGQEAAQQQREQNAVDYKAAAAHRLELAKNFSDGQGVEHAEWGRGVIQMPGGCEDARVQFEIEFIPGSGERMRTRLIDIADELAAIED